METTKDKTEKYRAKKIGWAIAAIAMIVIDVCAFTDLDSDLSDTKKYYEGQCPTKDSAFATFTGDEITANRVSEYMNSGEASYGSYVLLETEIFNSGNELLNADVGQSTDLMVRVFEDSVDGREAWFTYINTGDYGTFDTYNHNIVPAGCTSKVRMLVNASEDASHLIVVKYDNHEDYKNQENGTQYEVKVEPLAKTSESN